MPSRTWSGVTQTGLSLGLKTVVAVGGVAAAVSLVEAALIPGIAIGAAAALAPKVLSRRSKRRQRPANLQPIVTSAQARSVLPAKLTPQTLLSRPLHLKQATLKTISFRVIMTTFDFGFNYVILGELVTAAGLSTVSVVAGPFFYFVHETGWSYIKPLLPIRQPERPAESVRTDYVFAGYRVSQALAKTVTYRLFATASEFGTNYVVVQDLVTAAWLSAFGFFAGPFIYFAHERLWEGVQPDRKMTGAPAGQSLIGPPTLDLRPA